ncbi:hypothetical protein [Ralstonia sp. 25mfcol4.1]|uniref:hypothetical protein n=1 Tax=Ralstonia sp. 25mfcol4.1 TaxID=1761899 RepID=UPI0011133D9E|nr:hypothetical protein [Ralstonia sp. 25mfcol4.1]
MIAMKTALFAAALGLMASLAQAGPRQHAYLGLVLDGNCPTGQVLVQTDFYAEPGSEVFTFFVHPDPIRRCLPADETLQLKVGDRVFVGAVGGKLQILSRAPK